MQSPEDRPHRLAEAALLLGVVGSVVALSFRPLTDYDLPWNLATGRIIWSTRAIPRVDDLAFTARPLRYVEPLGDLLLYLTQHAFGARGLQVLGACLAGLTLLTLYAAGRRAGPIALLITGFAAAALADWFYLRPVLFSYAALPFTLLLLSTHRASPGTRRGRLALGGLVVLHLVWANIHGFVAIGCALVVGYAGFRLVARFGPERAALLFPRRDGSDLGFASGAAALVAVASSLSPGGPRLLLGSLRYGEVNTGITEWARPGVHYLLHDQPVATAFVAIVAIAWLCGHDPESGRRVPDAFSLAVVAVALFAFGHAVRMTPTAVVLLGAIAPSRLSGWVRSGSVAAIACGAAPLGAMAWIALSLGLAGPAGFDQTRLPEGAVRCVEAHDLRGHPYNFSPFGGYLAWRLYPGQRVFMDGRNALARESALVERARRAQTDAEVFRDLVREFGMTWALTSAEEGTSHDRPLAAAREWALVYLDDVGAVYVRRDGPNGHLAAEGYRRLRHLVAPARVLELALRGEFRQELGHDGALARQQAPLSPRAAFLDACGALANRDAPRFREAERHLAEVAPAHPAAAVLAEAWARTRAQ
jgi:hypothetical protein